MTKLTKPVSREIETLNGTRLVVTLSPEGILLREKGRRAVSTFLLPYGVAYVDAIERKRAALARAKRRGIA